jgi:hypothetical protein
MRFKQTSTELISLLVLSLTIVMLFRNFSKTTASLVASSLFFIVPLGLMKVRFYKLHSVKAARVLWWVCVAQFWVFFAGPIFYMRLFHWSEQFAQTTLFGIQMGLWHKYSSTSFMVMGIAIFFAEILEQAKKNRSSDEH